jgi:hypothetical protein
MEYVSRSSGSQSRGSNRDIGRFVQMLIENIRVFDFRGNLPNDHLLVSRDLVERPPFRQDSL